MAVKAQRITGALQRDAVKKNVAAIHVSGKLTLLQRKLSNVLLLNAYDDLLEKRSHKIDAKTLCLMIGYNSNDIESLKVSLRGLAETVAEWDMLNAKGKHEWGVSSLLSFAKLSDGVCEYAYSPALAEKLFDPKIFALINLNIQKRFSSGHGLALYENCYRFVRTGSTGWWDIDIFRRLMGVADSEYYQSFKHLNAKIIKPAMSEVNKTSNIEIEPEFRKLGRQVSEIRFLIKENPQMAMFDIDDSELSRQSGVYDKLRELGVSDRLSRGWIGEHGEDYVAQKLDYVGKRAGEGKIKGSAVPYLTAAIRDNYVEVTDIHEPKDNEQAKEAIKARKLALSIEDAEREKVLAQKRERNEKIAVIEAYVLKQAPMRRVADKQAFMATLGDDLSRAHFERDGWGSLINASAIIGFFENLVPGIFDAPN